MEAAAVAAIVGGYLYFRSDYAAAAAELPALEAKARSLGIPLSREELFPPFVPLEENAATYYRRADKVGLRTAKGADFMGGRPLTGMWNVKGDDVLKALSTYAEAKGDYFAAVEKACELEKCHYIDQRATHSWSAYGFALSIRTAQHMILGRALLQARMRHWDESIADLDRSVSILNHVATTDIALHQVTEMADAVVQTSLAIITVADSDPDVVAKASVCLARARATLLPEQVLAIEAGYTLESVRDFRVPNPLRPLAGAEDMLGDRRDGFSAHFLVAKFEPELASKAFQASYLRYAIRGVELVRDLREDPVEGSKELGLLNERARESFRPSDTLTRLFMPLKRDISLDAARYRWRLEAGQAALKAINFRKEHGVFPSSLSELGVSVIDPATELPAIYKRTADGFLIYGVGRNNVDDGGRFTRDTRDPLSPDVRIVQFPAPLEKP